MRAVAVWLSIVVSCSIVGASAYSYMKRSDATKPPPASYCDHGVRVWPGSGVFPTNDCAQR